MTTETIYALSSGIGRAGVSVIRVSGPAAALASRRMTRLDLTPRKAMLARLRHPVDDVMIDQALILWFPAPNSFTGEEVVEFHVHGGRAVVSATLDALSSVAGLRAAEPGEFTRRAFANGKLDLASAEGLADLISADTELQRRQALAQFSGQIGKFAGGWRQQLIEAQALIEAHLDFPDEEEIPSDVTRDIGRELAALASSLDQALRGQEKAEILRDGASVLIAGPPNSGKSTLLNRIAARDVAIISEIPGTTRDLIEITIDLRGIPVNFIDSAGIRETDDPIENQGIVRTRERAERAQLVIWLEPADQLIAEAPFDHPHLRRVMTKCDLSPRPKGSTGISALTGEGVQELLDLVYEWVSPSVGSKESSILSTRRQFDCVAAGLAAVIRAIDLLAAHNLELVVEELRLAARSLQELTGVISNDDLLDEVFGRFCLGK